MGIINKSKATTILQDDIRGKRFNKLLVIGDNYKIINMNRCIECKCDCGKTVFKKRTDLKNNNAFACSYSCAKRKDLKGLRFGKLTCIKYVGSDNGKTIWLCKCDCGNETKVRTSCLKKGSTKGCGCGQKEHLYKISNGPIRKIRCPTCQTKIEVTNIRQKFCSKVCNYKYKTIKRNQGKVKEIPCLFCQKNTSFNMPHKKFCSVRCMKQYHYYEKKGKTKMLALISGDFSHPDLV